MDSAPEPERWIICPVCNKKNPLGVQFCQHCWGAVLNQDEPLTDEELEEVAKRRENYLKRRKRIKLGVISLVSLAFIFSIILIFMYHTDYIISPSQDINSNPPPGEWTMFRHDLTRTGSTGDVADVPEGKLKWVFSTGAPVHSSPTVVNGTVYFGSQDYHLYALDAETGEEKWNFKAGSWVESSPAVSGGVVYVGSNDGYLYALDSDSGEKIWSFKTKYPVRSSPAVAGGVVYFGSDDYYLYALDATDGAELWRFDTDSPAVSSPAVYKGIVYIGSGHGYSYALSTIDGQRRLRYKTYTAVYTSPAVSSNGTVYFATSGGVLTAIDGRARTWLWEHDIRPFWAQLWAMMSWLPKPPLQSGFIWSLNLYIQYASSPIIDGNTIYLGSNTRLIAVDANTKSILWVFNTGGNVQSSPALSGSVLYVGSDDGNLYAVDASTGKELWEYATGDSITSSPAVVDGVVYVGSHDGNLYAIE